MGEFKSALEYAKHIQQRVQLLLRDNKPFRISVLNDMKNKSIRIFENGQMSDGSQIGQYSTTPMYANPNFAPRKGDIRIAGGGKLQGLLPTIGKPTKENPGGEKIFTSKTAWRGAPGTKAGDPHRTTYLKGGYKELRNRTGRRIDRVNLRFTNDLFMDWANSSRPSGTPTPTRINQHLYMIKLKRSYNVDKLRGLEKKYGKIFNSTKNEEIEFLKTLQFNFIEFLKGDDTTNNG